MSTFNENVKEMAEARLAALNEAASVLESELAVLDAERRQVNAILRTLMPREPRKRKQAKPGAGAGDKFSPAQQEKALAWLEGVDGETDLTSAILAEATGVSKEYASNGMAWLRANGYIRLSGQMGVTRIYRKEK